MVFHPEFLIAYGLFNPTTPSNVVLECCNIAEYSGVRKGGPTACLTLRLIQVRQFKTTESISLAALRMLTIGLPWQWLSCMMFVTGLGRWQYQ